MYNNNILTWNVGTNSDYIAMEDALGKTLKKEDTTWKVLEEDPFFGSPEDFSQHRIAVNEFRFQRIKDILKAFAKDVSIFCLQEVERDWQVEKILPNTFDFFKKGDEVIAWDTTKFSLENPDYQISDELDGYIQQFNPLFALATLKANQINKNILVCSAHLTGCNPDAPIEDDAMSGNNEMIIIGRLIKEISEKAKISHAIIGVDANTTREYPERLDILRENGFVVDTAEFPTNLNLRKLQRLPNQLKPLKTDNPLQKIDYIATLGGTISPLEDEFFYDEKRSIPLMNLKKNPSDHIPVIQTISLIEKGFFARLADLFS